MADKLDFYNFQFLQVSIVKFLQFHNSKFQIETFKLWIPKAGLKGIPTTRFIEEFFFALSFMIQAPNRRELTRYRLVNGLEFLT